MRMVHANLLQGLSVAEVRDEVQKQPMEVPGPVHASKLPNNLGSLFDRVFLLPSFHMHIRLRPD